MKIIDILNRKVLNKKYQMIIEKINLYYSDLSYHETMVNLASEKLEKAHRELMIVERKLYKTDKKCPHDYLDKGGV